MTGTVKLRAALLAGAVLAVLTAGVLAAPAAFAGTAPSAPSSLKATSTTFSSVALAWNPASSTTTIDGYRILVNGAPRTFSFQRDGGSVTGLLPGRTYDISVQAQDLSGGLSPQTAPVRVTTLADQQAPTAPSGLNDVWSSDGIFVLSWNRSSDNADSSREIQYQVYAGSDLVETVSGAADSALLCLNSGNYTFTVRARDRSGNLSAPSNPVVATG